ncbi:uncharacterized protein LOC136750585 [Amia ocellicauda]|uniref:uncharacterized protein LOC136750585 n=1 Tax=Amia ocellicauda TaxID=2972642 RepID=UPI003464D14D
MKTVLWMCFAWGVFSWVHSEEGPTFSQTPKFISLQKENSSAEIHCVTSVKGLDGLYLKRRYAKKIDVLYLSFDFLKETVGDLYKNRITIKGQCCDFVIILSQLTVSDSDVYYCSWNHLDLSSTQLKTFNSNGTLIIVKEEDPMESCRKRKKTNQILFIISVTVGVTLLSIFICVLVWFCTGKKKSYKPAKINQKRKHICLQHQGQEKTYPLKC